MYASPTSTRIIFYEKDSNSLKRLYDVIIIADAIITTVTMFPEIVNEWINKTNSLLSKEVDPSRVHIGLDIQQGGGSVATLHLCVKNRCLIFQIFRCSSLPPSLSSFFADPKHIFMGTGVRSKLDMLQSKYGIGGNAMCEDLGILAAIHFNSEELRIAGIKDLEEEFYEDPLEMPNVQEDDNWHCHQLSEDKVLFACINVHMCWELGRHLYKYMHKVNNEPNDPAPDRPPTPVPDWGSSSSEKFRRRKVLQ